MCAQLRVSLKKSCLTSALALPNISSRTLSSVPQRNGQFAKQMQIPQRKTEKQALLYLIVLFCQLWAGWLGALQILLSII